MLIKSSIYIPTFGMIILMYVFIYVDSSVGSAHACLNKAFFKEIDSFISEMVTTYFIGAS